MRFLAGFIVGAAAVLGLYWAVSSLVPMGSVWTFVVACAFGVAAPNAGLWLGFLLDGGW